MNLVGKGPDGSLNMDSFHVSTLVDGSWPNKRIQFVELVIKNLCHIPRYYFYHSFDTHCEALVFKPFWKIPVKTWLKRWGWGKRLLDRINARQLEKQREKNESEMLKKHNVTKIK